MKAADHNPPIAPAEPTAPLCPCLRTKTAFGSFIGDYHPWQEGASSTAAYWCLRTMGSAGPDDQLAHPRWCRPGRVCFEHDLD